VETSSKNLVKSTLIVMATIATVLLIVVAVASVVRIMASRIKYATEEPSNRTRLSLLMLKSSLLSFKSDTGRFPTQEEGLMALIEKPSRSKNYRKNGYLETKQLPKDGWERDFIYIFHREGILADYEVKSLGPDGKDGGGDDLVIADSDVYFEY
jgi:general secretion pathway protein G